jgi:hypothetical protein
MLDVVHGSDLDLELEVSSRRSKHNLIPTTPFHPIETDEILRLKSCLAATLRLEFSWHWRS